MHTLFQTRAVTKVTISCVINCGVREDGMGPCGVGGVSVGKSPFTERSTQQSIRMGPFYAALRAGCRALTAAWDGLWHVTLWWVLGFATVLHLGLSHVVYPGAPADVFAPSVVDAAYCVPLVLAGSFGKDP